MINEKNKEMNHLLWYYFQNGFSPKAVDEALTAIYEIGLECIGADEDPKMEYKRRRVGINRRYLNPTQTVHNPRITVRNELRASQRKAWAKACGVAEK